MKVSVALACYNGEDYIGEQLLSIKEQTRPVDEVVISDDGSSDGTVSVVRSFIEQNGLSSTWTLLQNEKNLGFAENFRSAIDSTTGDVFFLSDQDDLWVPDRVEKMTAVMERYGQIGVLNTEFVTFSKREELQALSPDPGDEAGPEQIPFHRHTRYLQAPGCVMCVRRTFYESVRENWFQGWAHDEFLWCTAVLTGKNFRWKYDSLLRRTHEKQTSGHLGHSREKRILYLETQRKSSECLLRMAQEKRMPRKAVTLLQKNCKMYRYRLRLVRDKKRSVAFPLLLYLGYYASARSYPVELQMAWKGKV